MLVYKDTQKNAEKPVMLLYTSFCVIKTTKVSIMIESRKKYIHIEGTDLAGKTTVANEFMARQTTPWEHRQNSILKNGNALNLIADEMFETGAYRKITLNLAYAAAILVDLDAFTWPSVDTLQESTNIVRSIGHARLDDSREVETLLTQGLQSHPNFDHSFYLTASPEARLERLSLREDTSRHDMILLHDADRFFAMDKISAEVSVARFNSKIIDTTDLTVQEVVDILEGEVFNG